MVVLVVDDSETVLSVVSPILRRSGYRVLQARNVAEARHVWARQDVNIDLVVTDVQMPDGTGFELSREIRADRPHTPVVFMSGGYEPQDPDIREILGPNRAFLAKPFSLSALLARIVEITSPPLVASASA
jgi:two-component system cell cycle sensor histidine kinase/response regulator CckA